jgi:uncharacterized pyridoxamine 5'-phosphate oxidase family protein
MEKAKYNAISNLECRGNIPQRRGMDSVLNEKQIKIVAITESKKKQQGTINTNNYIVICGVNQKTQAKQV